MVAAQLLSALPLVRKKLERHLSRWRARSASNFKLRLAMLAAFGFAVTVAAALVFRLASPEDDFSSALFTVYGVLWSIPGADITNNESFLATVMLNVIFVFGLLVFATILAMISDEINTVMLAARSGKAPLELSGHLLMLNWNQQAPFILEQLEQLQGSSHHPFAGRPLVILAEQGKEELDSLVLGLLKSSKLEVHTRSGKPYKLEHLVRVAAADAAAVLVMHPDGGGSGDGDGGDGGGEDGDDSSVSVIGGGAADDSEGAAALKLQTIMALTSQLAGKPRVSMVVQAPDDDNAGLRELDAVLMRAGHPANLMNLPVKKMLNSLAVQTTLQPWSAAVYHSILQQGCQPSMAFVPVPQALFALKAGAEVLEGGLQHVPDCHCNISFEEARVAVQAELLSIGYVSGASGQLHLNPEEGSRLSPGDILVALTTQANVAKAGVKLPLSARLQASLLQTAVALQGNPVVAKLLTLMRTRTASAALPAPEAAAAVVAEIEAGASSSSAGGRQSTAAVAGAAAASAAATAAAAAQSTAALKAIEPAAAVGAATPKPGLAAITEAPSGVSEVTAEPTTTASSSSAAAAAAAKGGDAVGSTPAPAGDGSSSGLAPPTPAATAPTAVTGAGSSSHGGASAAAGLASAAPIPEATAAADDSAAVPAAAVAAAAAAAQPPSKPATRSVKKRSPFMCCFAAPAVEEGEDEEGSGSATGKKPSLAAAGGSKATSFKLGKAVTGAVATVGKTAMGAVNTVTDGAAMVGKAAVNTVTDGAALVGKTVVSTATAVTDVVTTVADGAVGLGKTVATGAVSTVAGGAGFIGKTVTSAVKAPASFIRPDSASATNKTAAGTGGLLGAGGLVGGLFGAGKKMTQGAAKALAFDRLAGVDVAAARAPPTQPLSIVVAGFSAAEAAAELLPHFLSFAPAGSTVTFVTKEQSPPEGFEQQGSVEEEEEREDAEPLHHLLHYKFLPSDTPTSSGSLTTAGLHGADAVLLAADEGLRGNPAQADAQVLTALVSIQHLLATRPLPASQAGKSTGSSASAGAGLLNGVTLSVTNVGASAFKAAGTAVSFATRSLSVTKRGQSGSEASASASANRQQQQQQQRKVPHVVACVSTTSSKTVAAAFFGPPAAGCGSGAAAAGAAAAAGGGSVAAAAAGELASAGVVGSRLFTYELLVPGEIEGSVLVQVANQPLYIKVVHEMLVTSEGCELYLLPPTAFGFRPGEQLAFTEVQEVGRLLRRTAIGVFTGSSKQQMVLVPDPQWRWTVAEGDRIAVIAESW